MLGRHLPAEPQPLGFVIVVLFWGLVFLFLRRFLLFHPERDPKLMIFLPWPPSAVIAGR